MDSRKRSLVKSITYRIMGSLTTGLLVFIMTGKINVAGTVAFLDIFSKIFIYYLHERMWQKIKI